MNLFTVYSVFFCSRNFLANAMAELVYGPCINSKRHTSQAILRPQSPDNYSTPDPTDLDTPQRSCSNAVPRMGEASCNTFETGRVLALARAAVSKPPPC